MGNKLAYFRTEVSARPAPTCGIFPGLDGTFLSSCNISDIENIKALMTKTPAAPHWSSERSLCRHPRHLCFCGEPVLHQRVGKGRRDSCQGTPESRSGRSELPANRGKRPDCQRDGDGLKRNVR